MVAMVLLVAMGLTMVGLLGVLMVAMTRHLLAHPEDAVHTHGAGSWSDGLTTEQAASPVPDTPALLLATSSPRANSEVPLDDMPAQVVAEAARRARDGR